MIASLLLPALFVGSGLFAIASLAAAWRTWGRELRVIRAALAGVEDCQEFTVRLKLTETRELLPTARRGGIRATGAPAPRSRPAWRAAA